MNTLRSIAVYCGSSMGADPLYGQQAWLLGQSLALRRITLVYGGAKVGLMRQVADGAISQGGEVTGVLPRFLMTKDLAHEQLTTCILVDTMHERKYRMSQLCDGFIALPGSYGTLDELFEMLTWSQLGLHKKPIALLNTKGFYTPLLEQTQRMTDDGFLKENYRRILIVSEEIPDLLEQMYRFVAPTEGKWVGLNKGK